MNTFKKIASIFVSVLLWLIILLAALFAFTTLATRDDTHVANFLGYTPMVVETDSMSPTFNSGDLIVVKTCDPDTLEVGDIITFHTIIMNEYALNTHRIESIDEENGVRSYTTKGDNNDIADTHIIGDSDIVGLYVGHVSGLGKVMDFLSSSVGFLIVIVLPMLLFFIYQVYHLIMVSMNLKKAVAAEETEEQARKLVEMEEQRAAEAKEQPDEADEAKKMLAEAERIKAEAEAMKAKAEAEAALAEAKRMKAEVEAQLAQMKKEQAASETEKPQETAETK